MKVHILNTYMVMPCLVFVVNDSSPKTPCRVDTGAGDGDGGQVNHENSKSNWEWGQNLPNSQIN